MSEPRSLFSRFARGALAVGVGNLAALVLGFFSTMVASRHIAADAFGAFVLLEVVAGLLAEFSAFGLDLSVAKFLAGTDDGRQKRELINTVLLFRVLMIVIVCSVFLVVASLLPAGVGLPILSGLAVFVPLLCLLMSSRRLLKSVLQGYLLFRRMAAADSIESAANLCLTVVFVLFLDRGVIGLIHARVIALSLSCAVSFISIPIRKRPEFNLDLLKGILAFGFPLYINDVLSFAFGRIGTFTIGTLLGPADIAYYAMAGKIPTSIRRVYDAFRVVYFSFMSKFTGLGDRSAAERLLNTSTRLVSFVCALGALCALVFADDVFKLAFSEQYLPSVPAFVVLMVGLSITLVSNILGTSLVAIGDSDKPPIVNTVDMIVRLLGNVLLVPTFGVVGAALASLSGPSATNPLNALFLRRRGMDVRVKEYVKPLLLLGAYLLLVLLFKPVTFLHKISIIGLFILSSVVLSVITREEIRALLDEGRRALIRQQRGLPLRGART